jgi:hypothetical protein
MRRALVAAITATAIVLVPTLAAAGPPPGADQVQRLDQIKAKSKAPNVVPPPNR